MNKFIDKIKSKFIEKKTITCYIRLMFRLKNTNIEYDIFSIDINKKDYDNLYDFSEQILIDSYSPELGGFIISDNLTFKSKFIYKSDIESIEIEKLEKDVYDRILGLGGMDV